MFNRLAPALTLTLCACIGQMPEGDEINVTRKGDQFLGVAGPEWSRADLRANLGGVICPDSEIAEISINRGLDEVSTFTGACA
jgi:hypothetical protein